MTCTEAYEALLVADLQELDGTQEGPLGRHLRECPRCRALAQSIRIEEAGLGQALLDAVPAPELDRILDREAGRARRRRHARVAAIPMAVAAAVAGILLTRQPQLPGTPYVPPPMAVGLDVEAPQGRNVAVLTTDNPDITVLWLF